MKLFTNNLIIATFLIVIITLHANDNNGNGITDEYEIEFASMYAPNLNYHENNPLFPMPVDEIYTEEDFQNAVDGHVPLPIEYHSPQSWKNYFETVLIPQNITPTVYFNIFTQEIDPDVTYTVIQYWFYYPFNDAGNLHEGDWEHVAVIVNGTTPSSSNPIGMVFHHHFQLSRIIWEELDITDGHPNIFIGGNTIAKVIFSTYQGMIARLVDTKKLPEHLFHIVVTNINHGIECLVIHL